MDGSSPTLNHRCHIRSTSLLSRSHPLVFRVKEEMHMLKVRLASSKATTKVLCDGLGDLVGLYSSIEELLHLPSNKQSLAHQHQQKLLEQELEVSVRLLDLCGNMRDSIVAVGEHVQDLRLALRRRGDTACIVSGKKAKKGIKNCLKELKQLDSKHGSNPTLDKDSVLSLVIMVLIEAREVTISLFQSILSFLSILSAKTKDSRWSFVSKALNKRRVACEFELEDRAFSLSEIYECVSCKDVEGRRTFKEQEQLDELEVSLGDLESGMECLFKGLIQNRVALLNILSL